MILAMSPQDGAIKPLPTDLKINELANGSIRAAFPDGSVRELIPGAEGEGRMITTLADGARIQSDLTVGNGQVTVASISSTGEKTFLSLNENGASMQRISAAGEVSNAVPESATELVQSFREVEAFTQAEEFRAQEQFQENTEFGDWNNFGKPADMQPDQSWQPPQNFDGYMPPAAYAPAPKNFDGGYNQPMYYQPPQNFDGYMPPAAYAPPVQNFDGGYNQPMYYQPPAAYAPPVQNFDGGYNQPMYYQPPAAYAPPVQNFDGGYNQPMYYQPPAAYAPPVQNFDGGYNQPMYYQPPTATGFAPMPPMDASGFPIATSGANVFNAKSSFSSGPDFADVSSVNANLDTLQFESFEAEDSIQQFPQQ
jgi:hypothetical protein